MNKKYLSRFGLLIGISLVTGGALAQQGDAERGQAAAATCTACHQPMAAV